MIRRARAISRLLSIAAILALAAAAAGCAWTASVREKGIAVYPASTLDSAERCTPSEDGALLTHLVLSVTPRMDVRLRRHGTDEPDLLHIMIARPGAREGVRAQRAIELTERTLQTIPKKRWRKRAVKRLASLDLRALGERRIDLLLDALKARSVGDPERASALLREAVDVGPAPLLEYMLGVSLLETGDLQAASEIFRRMGEGHLDLPPPMRLLSEAVVAASGGDTGRALRLVEASLRKGRALAEGYGLRARMLREACDRYVHDRILADLDRLLLYQPCCAACTLDRAELESFTGNPWWAETVLSAAKGCVEEPLERIRDRAMALALASIGSPEEALDAAARAEARGADPLRAGLAASHLLSGDHARLDAVSAPAGDDLPSEAAMVERHLYGGLNHFWQGRPSVAAEQFGRGEELARGLLPDGWTPRGTVQLLLALRIRALMAAGRFDEAVRVADEARAAGKRGVIGFVIYTGAMADIAAGEVQKAQREMRRLIRAEEKPWLYLVDFEARLGKRKMRRARVGISNALHDIDTQINFCPGVPMEPYVLDAQARLLLADGRPDDAERVLRYMLSLGPRGLFAPDLLVPAWELIGRAREAQGDRNGALEAYREVLARWGEGEEIPLLGRVEGRIRALDGLPGGGEGAGEQGSR